MADVDFVPPFAVEKVDDVTDCVSPRDGQITYTISYDYPSSDLWQQETDDFDSIVILDELPDDVDFVAESSDPNWNYYESNHCVVYAINPNFWDGPGSIKLVVEVNDKVQPTGEVENTAKIKAYIGADEYIGISRTETNVCDCSKCVEVIYVDENVPDPCDGSSWEKAFKKLQDALAVARSCDEIWVADGTYKPTTDPCDTTATFPMVSGVGVFGGFDGTEDDRYERNWADPAKEAILSGDIGGSGNVDNVVVSNFHNIWILDGFTITGGSVAGVYCKEGSPIIQHNKIMSSDVGVYCESTEKPVFKNNWIYRNNYGLYFEQAADALNFDVPDSRGL